MDTSAQPHPERLAELRAALTSHSNGYQVEAQAFVLGCLSQQVTDEEWQHAMLGLATVFQPSGIEFVRVHPS